MAPSVVSPEQLACAKSIVLEAHYGIQGPETWPSYGFLLLSGCIPVLHQRRCVRPSIAHLETQYSWAQIRLAATSLGSRPTGMEAPATAYPSRNCRYVHQAKSILGAICTELTNSYTGTQACSRYTAQPRSRAHSWDAQGEGCYPSAHIIGMVKGLKSILPRNRYRKGRIMESRVQR